MYSLFQRRCHEAWLTFGLAPRNRKCKQTTSLDERPCSSDSKTTRT
jgi:hypothetical protein